MSKMITLTDSEITTIVAALRVQIAEPHNSDEQKAAFAALADKLQEPLTEGPMDNRRKHLVKSAGYWFDAAYLPEQSKAHALMCMENAYNHVENALVAALRK